MNPTPAAGQDMNMQFDQVVYDLAVN